jgi:hypothetical protein
MVGVGSKAQAQRLLLWSPPRGLHAPALGGVA